MANQTNSERRILVLGPSQVGKTALVVRFLTRRFIGEYESSTDITYKSQIKINGETTSFNITDTTGPLREAEKYTTVTQQDIILVVYSITDKESFISARQILGNLISHQNYTNHDCLLVLLGNKVDVNHNRQVAHEEGMKTSADGECVFYEVSAAEDFLNVQKVFFDFINVLDSKKEESQKKTIGRKGSTAKQVIAAALRRYNRYRSETL